MAKKMNLDEILSLLRHQLPELRRKYKVGSLGVFGSRVRVEEQEESDLDLLVEFTEVPGLLTYIELENHLSDLLGIKVDLVMKSALKPQIGERILGEVISL